MNPRLTWSILNELFILYEMLASTWCRCQRVNIQVIFKYRYCRWLSHCLKDRIQSTDRSILSKISGVSGVSAIVSWLAEHMRNISPPQAQNNSLRLKQLVTNLATESKLRISIRKPGNVFCQSTQVKMVTWKKKTPFCFQKKNIDVQRRCWSKVGASVL